MPTVHMKDTFEKNSEVFLVNADAAYYECASGIANLDKIISSVVKWRPDKSPPCNTFHASKPL